LFFGDVGLLRLRVDRAVASYSTAAFDGGFAVGQQLVALGLVLPLFKCVAISFSARVAYRPE